jgi:hypothetical protein
VSGRVERRAHRADLAVHHAGRAYHVDSRIRLRHRHLGVVQQRRVVVHVAVRTQHATVPVRGELVQAQVRHDHRGVADLGDDVPDRHVEDARRVGAAGTDLVALGGHAEEHEATDAGTNRLDRRLAQRVAGVLDHAGHRGDRLRLGEPFPHEHRQDQLGRGDPGLRDQPAHGRALPQASGTNRGIHRRLPMRLPEA